MSQDRLPVVQAAQLFDLLGDASRLRVLLLLARHGAWSVTDLCKALGMTQPGMSHHLKRLRLGRLVESHRQRKFSVYSLSSNLARELLRYVSED
jgi:DNA-binding transcriptional ArsR family regulator